MIGALAAADAGAQVLLLERDLGGSSNLLVSGGLFPAAGSRFQRAAGVEDSAARWAADIRAKAGGDANEAIVDAVAARSADVAHFLADRAGVAVQFTSIAAPGHSVQRLHATPAASGRELHALMRAAVAGHARISVLDHVHTARLIERDGAVCGVEAQAGGEPRSFHARAVLLATGGFAANRALLAEFIPQVADALHIGGGPNDGCAIEWARALGAGVAMMDGYQGQGHVNPRGGTRFGMGLPLLGALLVNRAGVRFVREDIGPSELAAFVLAQPGGVALEVFDRQAHEATLKQGPYRDAHAAGNVISAPDPESLARAAGMDSAAFARTFADFLGYARGEAADPLGRTRFGRTLAAPLYAGWVTGALAHTQGGLRVDARARVCRRDGSPIAGLYAAGGAAASLAGKGGEGYLPGNGLGQSFGLGLIAGEEMASGSR